MSSKFRLAMAGTAIAGAVLALTGTTDTRLTSFTGFSPTTPAAAQEAVADALPRGRQAVEIVDGNYAESYFPNTEILGAAEMRITALGTGMPKKQ